jgi:peroxiredoxin
MSKRNRDKRIRNAGLRAQGLDPRAPVGGPRRWPRYAVALAVVALLGASFVVPKLFDDEARIAAPAQPGDHGHAMGNGSGEGDGLEVGTRIPAFAERDVVGGEDISARSLRGKRTLLFFSEGVMCQACFEQIRDIEAVGERLAKRGIDLVSITPDPPDVLEQAIEQYGIRTPMIADDDRDMSAAFDTLGQGMHPDTPGHAFVLVDERGKVVWQRDYWLEPYRTMYVEPSQLLAEIPSA